MANRPPKKTKRQKEQEELQKLQDGGKQAESAKGDDRNIVLVDEDFSEAEFEDRVWLYWERNKYFIVGTIVAAFVVVLGVQYYNYSQRQAFREMQASYLQADTLEQKESFGAAYDEKALGGLALLEAADQLVAEDKFIEAAAKYEEAAKALKDTVFAGRARLGSGMAYVFADNLEAGRSILLALTGDAQVAEPIRAEAAYHLAVLDIQAEDYASALDLLQSIAVRGWEQRAQNLITEVPELADLRQQQASETSVTAEEG